MTSRCIRQKAGAERPDRRLKRVAGLLAVATHQFPHQGRHMKYRVPWQADTGQLCPNLSFTHETLDQTACQILLGWRTLASSSRRVTPNDLPRAVVEVRVPRRPGAVERERELLVVLVFLAPHPKSLEHLAARGGGDWSANHHR